MSRDNAYLRDVLDSARAIRAYLQGLDRVQFEARQEKQDAVITPALSASDGERDQG